MKIIPNGLQISRARILQGLSMRELSRMSGVNESVISQMEAHNKSVAPKTAKGICGVLEKNFDELFTIKTKEETK